jgi:predicted small metal-binding protein
MKSQEDYKKQFRVAADDATEESAEVVEHFLRKHGKSPVIKEFISKDIPKGGEASDVG